MHRLGTALTISLLLILLVCESGGEERELKKGVRLSLGGPRVLGWASPEVVDWDNDGLNDVLVGHYSGALFLYLNRGLGPAGIEFEKATIRRQDRFSNGGRPIWAWRFNKANCVCPGPGRISPVVLDWDLDGKKDLLIGDGRGAQLRVWRNIGTDSIPLFSTHDIRYLPSDGGVRPYHETVQPCIADWNSDGKRDLIMGRNRGLYVYLNKASNHSPDFAFQRSRLGKKLRDVFPSERLSPVIVDWDADGRQDLVVGSQSGAVWFAPNVGSKSSPRFKDYQPVIAASSNVRVRSEARIAVADLDGDGHKDLIVGDGTGLIRFFQSRNPAPVARSRRMRVKTRMPLAIRLHGTDDKQRPLAFRVLTQPKYGTLTGTAPNLSYRAKEGFLGRDKFTFTVKAGEQTAKPATVTIDVLGADQPPMITVQPDDSLVGIGQRASFRVVATGTPPFSYAWMKDGKLIPRATSPTYTTGKTRNSDTAGFSVTVKNTAGSVVSRLAALRVKPPARESDNVPLIAIQFKSPAIEPRTAGVLSISRTGNTSRPVTVQLATRRGHNPVIADLHYEPVPSSITLKAGQTNVDLPVKPIDDTLACGKQTLRFLIVPSPAYRIAAKSGAATMVFLDDDCPDVQLEVVKYRTSSQTESRRFEVRANPAPRRDTTIVYTVSGTAIEGADYAPLPGTVMIPAGKTSAVINIQPYRQESTGPRPRATGRPTSKTVVITIPAQPFTFFDFHRYLTNGRPQASLPIATAGSKTRPRPPASAAPGGRKATVQLRREVARLGWIVFSARSRTHGDLDVFRMRPDGTRLHNMTNTPDFDEYSARASRDGKRLLYRRSVKRKPVRPRRGLPQDVGTVAMRTRPPAGTLVLARSDGSHPRPVGRDGDYPWACWGPHGKQIACLEELETGPAKKGKPPQKATAFRIVIRSAETLKVLKTLPSAGIHSQISWSRDGKRICGAANILAGKGRFSKGVEYPLGVGKIASLEIASGRRTAVGRFPDWNPVWGTDSDADWFRGGSPAVVHSANNYGICPAYYAMLWRSGLEGKPSELLFAEYKRNIWGGCTSPDDKYAVFVIGEEGSLHGKLAIIRIADAPIARGRSTLFHEVLTDHFPKVNKGPVLDLAQIREAFDPQWTMLDLSSDSEVDN